MGEYYKGYKGDTRSLGYSSRKFGEAPVLRNLLVHGRLGRSSRPRPGDLLDPRWSRVLCRGLDR